MTKVTKKCMLINIEKVTFKNDETGEVKDMCKVNYIMPVDSTDQFCGNSIFECYIPVENFDKLKQYVLIPKYDFIYEERALKNGFKIFPCKIADVDLRKS